MAQDIYISVEHLRGIWGLEERAYTLDEIVGNAHLSAAKSAGALIEQQTAPDDLARHAPKSRRDKQEV